MGAHKNSPLSNKKYFADKDRQRGERIEYKPRRIEEKPPPAPKFMSKKKKTREGWGYVQYALKWDREIVAIFTPPP